MPFGEPFGVFVAIEGFRRHVLVHHTQVSCCASPDACLGARDLDWLAPLRL
jgi:hypothetical protein